MTTANRAVRDNFAQKGSYVARSLPGMTVTDAESFVAVDCGLPSDTFNVIVALDLSTPHHLLAAGVSPFVKKRLPMALWYWEDADRHNTAALTAYGLSHTETHVAMVADLTGLRSGVSTPEGVSTRPVTQAEEVREYGAVIAGLFSDSDEGRQVAAYYRLLSAYPVGRFPALRAYIGRYHGEVVATGTLFVGQDTVGIYDIVTRADLRKRGMGSAMFARLMGDAKGYGRRHAVLQASPDGLGIYVKAGFSSVGTVHTFENRALLEDA